MHKTKNILIAPLNWGLGHASRCIPIIDECINLGHQVVIASDGKALLFLKKEFPQLRYIDLPSYNITYPKNGQYFKYQLFKNSMSLWKAIKGEHKKLLEIVKNEKIDLVISDNRLGMHHSTVKTVIITHQITVLTGFTTWLSTKLHQYFIKKFDQCWIPDFPDHSMAGRLSEKSKGLHNLTYIGSLSRFKKARDKDTEYRYDLMVLLSGPEPQRTLLEKKLLVELQTFEGKTLFVGGNVEQEIKTKASHNLTYHNYLNTKELHTAIENSKILLCRSGYSTIMDLHKLEKKAFFIPTPGQYEQEYLALHLKNNGIAPYCNQDNFNVDILKETVNYTGFTYTTSSTTSISSILREALSSVKENSDPIPSSLST